VYFDFLTDGCALPARARERSVVFPFCSVPSQRERERERERETGRGGFFGPQVRKRCERACTSVSPVMTSGSVRHDSEQFRASARS